MSRTFVDIHIIQDLPPSNLNRDDNGTPKQAVYGGVDRLRVSSQAWKRATRRHFGSRMASADLGVRTRRLHGLLSRLLVERGVAVDRANELAGVALTQIKITAEKKKEAGPVQSEYLLFAGRRQLAQLADALAEPDVDASSVAVADILGSTHSLDVALFGRMVADLTNLNVDAAAQVAHAISTHAAQTQFDYFTAVDDEQDKDEAGAGMIGTVEFNSATMYRFATVGLEQLVDNMGDRDAAIGGVGEFIRSFSMAMPSGKQNTFAAHTRPSLVAVVIRDDQPVNFVSAFESPVQRSPRDGLVSQSLRALGAFAAAEGARWGDSPRLTVASYAAADDIAEILTAAFGESKSLDSVIDAVMTELADAGDAA